MSNAVMSLQDYDGVCEKIRELTASTDVIKSGELSDKITEVYDKGRTDKWSEFWDDFQENGNRGNYNYAFGGYGWTDETFKPKYDIVPTSNPGSMFYMAAITDLEAALDNAGVMMDFSKNTNFPNVFYNASFTVIPVVNFSGASSTASPFNSTFGNSRNLLTIRKIILPSNGEQTFSSTFTNCDRLQNVVFEGVIGSTISFSSSPLSVASLKSIISCLKNYAGTGSEGSYTLTLKDECKTALQADMETVELDGVSYTYFELITAKGWNLA